MKLSLNNWSKYQSCPQTLNKTWLETFFNMLHHVKSEFSLTAYSEIQYTHSDMLQIFDQFCQIRDLFECSSKFGIHCFAKKYFENKSEQWE